MLFEQMRERVKDMTENTSVQDIHFAFDMVSKFHRSLYIRGWCAQSDHSGKPVITGVAAVTSLTDKSAIVGLTWDYVPDLPHVGGFAGGFDIQVLMRTNTFPEDLWLLFELEDGRKIAFTWEDIQERSVKFNSTIDSRFNQYLKDSNARTMLDIGGRARSGVLRSESFPDLQVEVLDVLPAEGVTVVCDAHRMSSVLPHNHFDAVLSVAVFEHLIMPWKVAIEMNRVMKKDAVAMIVTHQSIGMHDLPWDYFRFSDSAWKGMFNKHTGFEILHTELGAANFIIPFLWTPRMREAEKSAGFEFSAVLVKKTADTEMDWPLSANDVTTDMYPEGTEDRSGY